MSIRALIRIIAVPLLAVAGMLAVLPSASAAPAHTDRVVVRPVTSGHVAAPGWAVQTEAGGQVDCSDGQPSPAAVDDNILICSPSAEYAPACWHAARPRYVLCLRDARVHKLARILKTGPFPSATHVANRAPLDLLLRNGWYCTIRVGGAGPRLNGHPNLAAAYYCPNGQAIWAHLNDAGRGVNKSHPVWTVQTSKGGNDPLVTRLVVRAWLVGTAP